jgi:hypothetical protein
MKGLTQYVLPGLHGQLAARPARRTVPEEPANVDVAGASKTAFMLALLAVVLELVISGNTLTALGIGYDAAGGSPLAKFLPGTYFAALGAIAALFAGARQGRGVGYLLSEAPGLAAYLALTAFCMVYSAVNIGITGAGVYIDTYMSAGLLAVAMMNANDRQRAIFAQVILALCVANVLISVVETFRQEHFIPLDIKGENGKIVDDALAGEFRPAALYAHPLTGAMMTSFGTFLLLALDLRFSTAAACFGVLALGLLSFGGRASLLVTIGLLVAYTVAKSVRDVIRRRMNRRLIAAVFLTIAVLVPVGTYLMTATQIGERIEKRAYYDESARVRADQWLIFDKLSAGQFMYGVPAEDLDRTYALVGMGGVENPLILMFLNLGAIGLPILVAAVFVYFLYLLRAYPGSGWLLTSAVLILSSSNSIGVKSPDLFMVTSCAVALRCRRSAPHRREQIPAITQHRGLSADVVPQPPRSLLGTAANGATRPGGLAPRT